MSQESRNGERKPFAYYNPATMTFHRDGEMTREQRERFMPLYAEKSPRSETGDSADARNKERRAIRECIELAQEANALRKALIAIRDATYKDAVTLRGMADIALAANHEPAKED